MKLLQLDLAAFGSLHGIGLQLATPEPCLHVIYGANEAGKSTALRALQSLFYGIPENTPDAHRFKPSELRVGALLCDARGRELYVMRRKGRKHTLSNREGEPLHGPDVSWISAGVSEAQFRSLFALGYDTLEEGADELLGSAGELGESLFTAGAGGAGAHSVLEALQREADALYRPRGRNQRLNEVLLAFEDARRDVRERAIRAEAYSEQQRAIGEAEAEAVRLSQQRQQLIAERVKLERARRVVPLLGRSAECERERTALGDVALLPESAAEDRRRIERAARDAKLRIEHVELELSKLEAAVLALPRDDAWLAPAHTARLSELRDRLAQYRRARRELPARRKALQRARADVRSLLAQLGLPGDDPAALRVSRPLEAKLREQARSGETLVRRCSELERQLSVKRDQLMRQSRLLSQLRGAADPEPLAADGGEDAQIALPLSEPPPPLRLERTEEFERAFTELAQERALCKGRLVEEERALVRVQCDLDALAQAGEPPTEPQLEAAREQRRELLGELRVSVTAKHWSQSKQQVEQLSTHCDEADVLADRLRREATRVAEHARLRATENSARRSLDQLREAAAALDARERELGKRWLSVCAAAGVAPRAPSAMRGFLGEYRAEASRLEQLDREAGALLRELESERAAYAAWSAAWAELAPRLGRPADSAPASVAEVEAVLSGLRDACLRSDEAARDAQDIEALGSECQQFEAELADLNARLCPELEIASQEALAAALLERHAAAHSCAERRAALEEQLAARRVELRQAEAVQREAERELSALVRAARVEDPSQLEAAEEAARRARELDVLQARLHDELLTAADGAPLAQLELELLGAVAPELALRASELDDQLERLELERERALHTLEARRAGLAVLRDSRGAADAALEAGAQLENARLLAERYVRVRLAHGVLAREVERYRERHTGPILRGASTLFEALTGGAWTRLEADLDEHDKPILICVRRDGDRVGVAGLSAGTRDQLYLALRLASLEQLAAARELLPLVLDDLLVHFDDDRATSALQVLGGFARTTTQVLLFTHHSRLCELAEASLPADLLRIHRLAPQAVAELEQVL